MLVIEGKRPQGLSKLVDAPVFEVHNVDCVINGRTTHSFGSLYLTKLFILFISSQDEDYSLEIDFRAIGVHAICHSTDIYKRPCMYCLLSDPGEEQNYGTNELFDFDLEGTPMEEESDTASECLNQANPSVSEVLLSPCDETQLLSLFNTISSLQKDLSSGCDSEDDILSNNSEIAFDCDLEHLFQQADEEYRNQNK